MNPKQVVFVGILLSAMAVTHTAAGDVIRLKNGNVLDGEIEATTEQEVTVNVPGAGKLVGDGLYFL